MSVLNCMVAQSGGPTVAINASLAGVIERVQKSSKYDTLYGSINGILGILNDKIINLSNEADSDKTFLETLSISPAMYLGTCRYKLADFKDDDSDYIRLFKQFEVYDIDTFFYIGGNDSMDTVHKLSEYAKCIGSTTKIIGIPKTIDNDLCNTDHTPGFGSAAKYIASTVLEIAHDTFIYNVKSVTIIEIMGRDAGWLTASSALARNGYNNAPHLIYLPEVDFDKDSFIEDVKKMLESTNNVIVCVSEGIHGKDNEYISASKQSVDNFGHSQLSGAAKTLEHLVKNALGVKVRSIEINVLQRCAAHLSSATDINESLLHGIKAVEFAEAGITGCMVNITRTSNNPYTTEIGYSDIKDIANNIRSVPSEWINDAGNDVKQPLIDYIKPLIIGENTVKFIDGLPVYSDIGRLTKK